MDPGSSNEIRLDIDPNAFQFALRDGALTLVPKNPAAASAPLLQAPLPLQQPVISNGAVNSQLMVPPAHATRELALTLFYASQNNTLNEEQHRFLKQQLQQMRGSLEYYDQFVDQRRSLTAQRERGLQAGQQGSSSNARVNEPINWSTPSLATNTSVFNQASPFNPTMSGSPTTASFNAYPSSSYQQGTQRGQTNMNMNQAVPIGVGSTAGLSTSQSIYSNTPAGNQFQQWPPAQQVQIPALTQQVPLSNQRIHPRASSQAGLQSTNGTRVAGNNSRAPSGQHHNQDTPRVGPPSAVPSTAFIPNREAPTSAQQMQQYAHLYYSQTPGVSIPPTFTSPPRPIQARISPISTPISQAAAGADALKRAQGSNSRSSSSAQAANNPPPAPTVTAASTSRSAASQSTPARAPQAKATNASTITLPTASNSMLSTSPLNKTPATATTVSPIKEGSMAKALLNLFGKRKATGSSPSGEPASKRRATSPRASVPPASGSLPFPELSLGTSSGPGKTDLTSSAPMGIVKEESPSTPRIPEISDTITETTSAVPPVNSVLPFELGEPLDLPSFEHPARPSGITQPLFEVSLPANSDGGDSNLPRIEVLSDDVSVPPLSRPSSVPRQSSIPNNDAPSRLDLVDRIPLDVEMDENNAGLQDGKYSPLTPAVARSPSEPLFLPLSDDDHIEGVSSPPRRMRDIMKRPRRRFLYVQVPIPKGHPNPIRYGPRMERAKNKKGTRILISSSDEQVEGERVLIGPPRRALHDGYEQILRSEDAARLAPRSCQWISCEATLDSLQKLEKHVRIAHLSSSEEPERVFCRWKNCHMGQFRNLLELSNHLKKHLVSQRYCMHSDCDFSTRSAHLLTAHIRDVHNNDMSSLKPFVDELLSSPPIPVQSLPHKIPALEAFGPPVNGHPNARLEAHQPSPPSTPQAFAIMPLSPTKHAHRKEDEKERIIDKYSFLDPLWPPMLVMDELSGYGLDIFETEFLMPEVSDAEQRGASVDELLF